MAAPFMQVSQRLQVCYLGVIEAINASQLDLDQWQTGRIAWRRARGCQPTTEGACQAWDGFDLSLIGRPTSTTLSVGGAAPSAGGGH